MGWLTAKQGLSCDNLLAATLVTADGSIVRTSATEHPDRFWALRGAGANFGVVTEFEFALQEVSPMLNLGLFFWRPEDAREPLRFARDYLLDLPRGAGALVAGLSAPPAPFVRPEHQGLPGFAILVADWGTAEEHAATVQPLREYGPLFELVTPIPYVALQQMFDPGAPWGARGYEKALYLDELSDRAIDIAIDWLPRKTSPLSFTPIFPLGGRFAEIPDEATALGGSRRSRWVFNIAAIAPDLDSFAIDRSWVRGFWDALRPEAPNDATYVNFLAHDDDEARVRASYGEEKYQRLAAIKAEWDPDNVFHHNANVRPASAVPAPRAEESPQTIAGPA
jgi:hypothetical protein